MEVKCFDISNVPSIKEDISLCLGYFDGLHQGHLLLCEKALTSKYKSALLTFDFLNNINIKNKAHITSLKDKEEILKSLGFDYLFVLKFDENVMRLTPEEFVENIIIRLNAKEVVIGEDYTFGKGKKGNRDTLKELSNNRYNVEVCKELTFENKKIGTSNIISLIKDGNVSKAMELLTRFYKITGVVKKGYGFGNLKSVPTANIDLNNYIKPKNGVYATLVRVDDKIIASMTNVGIHPSINKLDEEIIETHLFDFNETIYDKTIDIYFVDFIREEKRFDSIEELYKQLENDKITCEKILSIYVNNGNIIPFYGIKNYYFNTLLENFKLDNYIDDVDVSLIGPSFEIDNHLYQVKHDDIIFSFDKDSNLLVEMDILSNKHGSLINGVEVGMDKKTLFEKDKSLMRCDINDLYISNNGYVIVLEEEKVSMILLFEKEFFKDLCFYFKDREQRDNDLLNYIELKTIEYLESVNSQKEDDLVSLYGYNLDITYKFVKKLKKNGIIKLGKVFSRLIHENNYFEDYSSQESLTLRDMILYINKKVK